MSTPSISSPTRAMTPPLRGGEEPLFQSIQYHIEEEEFQHAITLLLNGFTSIKTSIGNQAYVKNLYKNLFQLVPHFEPKEFGLLLQDKLPILLEYSSHLPDEQRQLAKQLAKWHLKNPQGKSFKDLLNSSLEAMNYYAKAIQITEENALSDGASIHHTASKIFMRIIHHHLIGEDGKAFAKRLDSARRGGQKELKTFEKFYSQLENCPRFCRNTKDQKVIYALFLKAASVFQNVKIDSIHAPFSEKFNKLMPSHPFAIDLNTLFVTQKYAQALKDFRDHFDSYRKLDERNFQVAATDKFIKLFQLVLDDALAILGPPPCHYDIRGTGSLARDELCPFSDFELFILIETDDKEARAYFQTLMQLIEISIVSLGETPNLTPLDFSALNAKNSTGIRIDIDGNPWKNPKLLATAATLANLQTDRDSPLLVKNTLLKSIRLAHSSLILFHDYENLLFDPIRGIMSKLNKERALTLFKLRFEDYEQQWASPFKLSSLNIKQKYGALLHYLLSDMALYWGIKSPATSAIIDSLIKKGVFSEMSGACLKGAIGDLYEMRISVHKHYGQQKEDVYWTYDKQPLVQGVYSLKKAEQETLQKIYWLILRPFYDLLKEVVMDRKAPEDVFRNSDLLMRTFEMGFHQIPLYVLRALSPHIFSCDLELKEDALKRANSPLHLAAAVGDMNRFTDLLRRLIRSVARAFVKESLKDSFILAASFNQLNVVMYLSEHVDNVVLKEGLDQSFSNELHAVSFFLLEKKPPPPAALNSKNHFTEFLKYACSKKVKASDLVKKDVIEKLLQAVKADRELSFYVDLIHIASAAANYLILKTLVEHLVENLSEANYKKILNTANSKGETALHQVLRLKSIPCALLLVAHGAEPSIPDTTGRTSINLAEQLDLWPFLGGLWQTELLEPSTLKNPIRLFPYVCQSSSEKSKKFVELLTSLKVDLDSYFPNQKTLLHYACQHNPALVERLLDAGAFYVEEERDNTGRVPLHWALARSSSDTEILILKLLNKTSDISPVDHDGNSCLHLAARYSKDWDADLSIATSMILLLIMQLVRGSKKFNGQGNTPLHMAIEAGNGLLALKLTAFFSDYSNLQGHTPITLAVEKNMHDVALELFDRIKDPKLAQRKTRTGLSLFALACENEMFSLALRLIPRGANLDELHPILLEELCFYGLQEGNQLIWDILKKHPIKQFTIVTTPLHQALAEKNQESARKLAKKGIYTDKKDHRGRLPLHVASAHPCATNIQITSENVRVTDIFGATPLHYLCRHKNQNPENYLQKGASLLLEDSRKRTPLMELLASGSNLPFFEHLEYPIALQAFLENESALWNSIDRILDALLKVTWSDEFLKTDLKLFHKTSGDWREFLALYHSISENWKELKPYPKGWFQNLHQLYHNLSHGHYDMLEFYHGLGIIHPSQKESKALMGFWRSPVIHSRLDLFDKLGFDIRSTDPEGNTPLHWACQCPHNTPVVDYLLDKGADPNQKNNKGHTALDLAKMFKADSSMIYATDAKKKT